MTSRRKKYSLMFVASLILFLSSSYAQSLTGLDIKLHPSEIGQGEVALLTIQKEGNLVPEVTWNGKEITMVSDSLNGMWMAFLGVDLTTEPGEYTLTAKCGDELLERQIPVIAKDHGTRRFTVSKKMEALDTVTLERVKKESKRMRDILSVSRNQPLWQGTWIRPLPGQIVSPFGCRTIINDLERSPHSGVDLRAPRGTPINAINKGQIVLVADHFFGGLSVVIDHGGGIHSMYFHLSEISVREGQIVEKGDLIGRSGSSGRATGPHLHFGIRLNNQRVNPLTLIELSTGLGQ
jgi:hypothetical protein